MSDDLDITRLDRALIEAAAAVLRLGDERGLTVVTAESCTGGLVAAALTDIAGSSSVVEGGFVTYSNEAKCKSLGVPNDMLEAHGAVSEPVARAMAEGALRASVSADLAVAITGIAGPGGATPGKPVGLVHFAAARRDGPVIHREKRYGDIGRALVRRNSAMEALALLIEIADAR
ncbi:CinA family protein [Flaviflagellibacter deserti]|uniref:CinA family protein n=1 Tax=Flaviflagellibacter deserti TaxID=2267266 RepID=A0ABV9Z0S4_9HYPH